MQSSSIRTEAALPQRVQFKMAARLPLVAALRVALGALLLAAVDGKKFFCSHARRVPPADAVPFVMLMPGRAGSSFTVELLSSHPDIAMSGEVFNGGGAINDHGDMWPTDSETEEMCNFFTAPTGIHNTDLYLGELSPKAIMANGGRLPKARGFKQKFFRCNSGALNSLPGCGLPADGRTALEMCVSDDFAEGDTELFGKKLFTKSYGVYNEVGAKIICNLRRNSFEHALSKATQVVLHSTCGTSNIHTPDEVACWEKVKKQGVHIDEDNFVGWWASRAKTNYAAQHICEAQARITPVFFLWYEELNADPVGVTKAMYKSLGVDSDHEPRYEMQKVNKGAETWLANYDRLKTLVETKDPCTVVLDERLANLDADGDELPQLEVTIGGGDAREAELGCATSPPPPVTPCPPPAVCPICPVTTECDGMPSVSEAALAASPSSPLLLPFVAPRKLPPTKTARLSNGTKPHVRSLR